MRTYKPRINGMRLAPLKSNLHLRVRNTQTDIDRQTETHADTQTQTTHKHRHSQVEEHPIDQRASEQSTNNVWYWWRLVKRRHRSCQAVCFCLSPFVFVYLCLFLSLSACFCFCFVLFVCQERSSSWYDASPFASPLLALLAFRCIRLVLTIAIAV